MTKVGFTGTQHGMTLEQATTVARLLREEGATVLHHGVCIGADEEAHFIGQAKGIGAVLHPPKNKSKMSTRILDYATYCPLLGAGTVLNVYSPAEYIDRNHDIVDATEQLIAAPQKKVEVVRSGTWATIRYACKTGKPVRIVHFDGSIERRIPIVKS